MMEGFLGDNQVKVKESEQCKNSLTTPWGTYVYVRMSCGLTNAGANFQRAMDVSFTDLINVIMVVYWDDLIAYSKKQNTMLHTLKKYFSKYWNMAFL